MEFRVDEKVFECLPNYCVGTVTAQGFPNDRPAPAVEELLDGAAARFAEAYRETNIRELPGIKACRDAFTALGMNPNKFMCSIEALAKRVQKGGALPHINPVVDLGNAFSLNYLLPMGAHDMDKLEGDLAVRFSTEEDHFLPMGAEEREEMPAGELVYASVHTVKTRRWLWRQSEDGKIGGETNRVFFPIDGFKGVNDGAVLAARDQLAKLLEETFGCKVTVGFVDRENQRVDIG